MLVSTVQGQELEPRAYSPAPVGANFAIVSYAQSSGDVLFDPSLHATDVVARVQGTAIGYLRTFGLAGHSASFALAVPYVTGHLTGNLGEQSKVVDRSGYGDARLRFAMNLSGGPALSPGEFAAREKGTAVGASLSVVAPTGEYEREHVINIGSNRWAIKPEIGVTHEFEHVFVEGAAGVWLYTDNTDFYGGVTRHQDPLWTFQLHTGYVFRPGLWLAADATFFTGGRTNVNGTDKQDLQENSRYGLTLSLPIDKSVSAKVGWSNGLSTRIGGNFSTWSATLQYRWFDRNPGK